ncbi:hypothetical protein D0Z08_28330 [Nocardioides immobilis]|uniref:Uncharacterized protein n=1 Tax=Nocardioides immobilis TaxID=2049295 RepID=A0A417XTC0_9ACTN|nr:hypothetical protein [Nocardioides immobilis]RHW23718.1 hypothetical protein D0Z08_28330 [Nocardioides immobilis]
MQEQVVILPGIPGQPGADFGLEGGVHPYPESTTDFVKLLHARGLVVEFRDPREARAEVGFKAMEIWLPALLSLLSNFLAIVLWELLDEYTRKYRDDTSTTDNVLHVTWEIELPDGTHSTFNAHGLGSEVRESFAGFVQAAGLPAPSTEALGSGDGGATTNDHAGAGANEDVAENDAPEPDHDVDDSD